VKQGKIDKVVRSIHRKLDQGVRVEDMTPQEQAVWAYELHGFGCHASNELDKFQSYDKIEVIRDS
jgi:hypothetical protein